MELALPPYGALIHKTVLGSDIHPRRADERPDKGRFIWSDCDLAFLVDVSCLHSLRPFEVVQDPVEELLRFFLRSPSSPLLHPPLKALGAYPHTSGRLFQSASRPDGGFGRHRLRRTVSPSLYRHPSPPGEPLQPPLDFALRHLQPLGDLARLERLRWVLAEEQLYSIAHQCFRPARRGRGVSIRIWRAERRRGTTSTVLGTVRSRLLFRCPGRSVLP